MRPKEEWESLSVEELEMEISLRRKLQGEMVGWLYPSILEDEIADLNAVLLDRRRARK